MKNQFLIIGIKELDKSKWINPINSNFIKPIGGLWASTYTPNTKHKSAWHEWCYYNMPHWIEEDAVVFELNKNAKILSIDGQEDFNEMLQRYTDKAMKNLDIRLPTIPFIDFEKIAQSYDCIHLTEKGEISTRFGTPSLYGWDCESLLILNYNCIGKSDYIKIEIDKEHTLDENNCQ